MSHPVQHRRPTVTWLLWRQGRRCSILNWWCFAAVLQNIIVRCPFQLFRASHHCWSGRCSLSATWQELRSWSTTDSNTQGRHRCSCASFHWTIQSFNDNQLRASRFQDYIHFTSSEKGRTGFIACAILPSNLQSISPFKATWKTRCSPAPWLSQLKRSATKIPVGASSSQLNRDRCAKGLDGHSSCSQRRRFVCPCSAEPISGPRYGRSWYSSASTGLFLSLVTSPVLSCLDYGNATLASIPQQLLRRLQSVMNVAAWLIYSSSRFDHITQLLPSTSLAEGKGTDWLQTRSAWVPMCTRVCASILCQWT